MSVVSILQTALLVPPGKPLNPKSVHKAQYSRALVPVLASKLRGVPGMVFDPFGGLGWVLGEIGQLAGVAVAGCEIEPAYFDLGLVAPWIFQGDATDLPFEDESIAAFCTSVTYGNGMGDNFIASNNAGRNTYVHPIRHALGTNDYQLAANSTAQYGFRRGLAKYQELHEAAWEEAARVLYGKLVLNCKDSLHTVVRKGVKTEVLFECTNWHIETLEKMGFTVVSREKVVTPGNREGRNGKRRVEAEDVVVLHSPSMPRK